MADDRHSPMTELGKFTEQPHNQTCCRLLEMPATGTMIPSCCPRRLLVADPIRRRSDGEFSAIGMHPVPLTRPDEERRDDHRVGRPPPWLYRRRAQQPGAPSQRLHAVNHHRGVTREVGKEIPR